MATCTHLDERSTPPERHGCVECLAMGGQWVHLRRCAECGHIGCCDSSPAGTRPPTSATGHPLVQSFEPREEWFYCYADDVMFEIRPTAEPVHP